MRSRAKARAPKKCSAWFPNRPAREARAGLSRGLRRGLRAGRESLTHAGTVEQVTGRVPGGRRAAASSRRHHQEEEEEEDEDRRRRHDCSAEVNERRPHPGMPRGPQRTASLAGSGHHRGGSGRPTSLPQCPAQWGRRGLGRSRAWRGPGERGECGGVEGGGRQRRKGGEGRRHGGFLPPLGGGVPSGGGGGGGGGGA